MIGSKNQGETQNARRMKNTRVGNKHQRYEMANISVTAVLKRKRRDKVGKNYLRR